MSAKIVEIWDSESTDTRLAIDEDGHEYPFTLHLENGFGRIFAGAGAWFPWADGQMYSVHDWVKVWPLDEQQSFIVSGATAKPRKEWQPDVMRDDIDVMDVTRGLLG